MQEQVDKYRNENQNLVSTVNMQEAELTDKQSQIDAKTQELALIEARVQELMIQSKMTEADAYFARAQAVEEAANRTKLAPKKKKETYREAIELYKKLSLSVKPKLRTRSQSWKRKFKPNAFPITKEPSPGKALFISSI